jgi:hypothetical protein
MSVIPAYPTLDNLIPVDKIPTQLSIIQDGIEAVFQRIHYKDLDIQKSPEGESFSYYMTLVMYKKVGIEIPGTGGMAILLNPGIESVGASPTEIPIMFGYQLDILKYKNSFSFDSFQDSAKSFFDILVDMCQLTETDFLMEILNVFIDSDDPVTDFILDFNTKNTPGTPLSLTGTLETYEEEITELLKQIANEGFDVFDTLFSNFVDSFDFAASFENGKKQFIAYNYAGLLLINATKVTLIENIPRGFM